MSIEQRLEALTERHEALTQSVELLLAQSKEHSRQLDQDGEHMRQLAQHVQALVRVAELHDQRITRIEEQG